MYLLGAALTKFLATLAAVMTVTTGLPSFQCRCPDGRVKLFCHGNASSPSVCCCAGGDSSSPEAKPCCEAKKANTQEPKAAKKRSCCHSYGDPKQDSGSDGQRVAAKAACCVKTVVAAAPVYSIVDSGTGVAVHQFGDALALWAPALIPSHAASGTAAARSPPGFLTTPPDLVVILCHFTC